MTSFPSSIIAFSTKVNGQVIDASHIDSPQDEITALENKVGVDGSAITTSLDFLIKDPTSNGGGHIQTANKGGTGQTIYAKGDILVASSSSVLSKQSAGADGTAIVYDSTQSTGIKAASVAISKFGGTGADGALTISSGATNIDLANAAVLIKNYTDISITGTGSLTFTNPNTNGTTVILKYTGTATLTSSTAPMINCSGLGGAGGAAISFSDSASHTGTTGTVGNGLFYKSLAGVGSDGSTGTGGAGGAVGTLSVIGVPSYLNKYPWIFLGAGGGSGGITSTAGTTSTSGAGGNGGGCLIMEGNTLNFTTANGISVKGVNGGNGSHSGAAYHAGGGGGGGGGYALIIYNTLVAASGTITVAGGTGGNSDASNTSVNGGGGGGSLTNAGNTGTNAASGAQSGGNGGAGLSLIIKNIEYT